MIAILIVFLGSVVTFAAMVYFWNQFVDQCRFNLIRVGLSLILSLVTITEVRFAFMIT